MLSPAREDYPIGASFFTTHPSLSCPRANPQQWSAFGTTMLSALEAPSHFSRRIRRLLPTIKKTPFSETTASNKPHAAEMDQDDARGSGDDE